MQLVAKLAIFLGAFIPFALEPLVGRTLLPKFGGVASVWVTCLTTFQVLLVAGYLYAHRICNSVHGVRLHLAFLFLSSIWLLGVGICWNPIVEFTSACSHSAFGTLLAVLILSAIPFVTLGANSTLLQVLSNNNYRLYSISNLGSFAGLVVYSLIFEPFISISFQWMLLAMFSIVYLVLVSYIARNRLADNCQVAECSCQQIASKKQMFLWYAIPAVTCFLLNAATSHLTSNVSPIPLLWAILLGVYLLSYVIGFSSIGEKFTSSFLWLGVCAVLFSSLAMASEPSDADRFLFNFCTVTAVIVIGCSGLHGWLYIIRPDGKQLTHYYLALAIGGALGGLGSGIIMPLVSSTAIEYPVSLILVVFLAVAGTKKEVPFPHAKIVAAFLVPVAVCVGFYCMNSRMITGNRNFYGIWRVEKDEVRVSDIRDGSVSLHDCYNFINCGTVHGIKPLESIYENIPTVYYGRHGGGLAFNEHPLRKANKPIRAAIVGMGVGVMAYWGYPNDYIRFYEINPQIVEMAKSGIYFDFLAKSQAEVDIVIGDARKALERERTKCDDKFDLLVVDAYSGDSIPLHLITEEAFRLYRDRLTDDGVLVLHISNWHMNLEPVCKAAGKLLGWQVEIVHGRGGLFLSPSEWAFLSKKPIVFSEHENFLNVSAVPETALPNDECGSILKYVKIKR